MAASKDKNKGLASSLDWFVILIYIALLAMGWMSVCGASYDFEQGGNFFDFGMRSGMQIVWIGTSFVLGAILLGIDDHLHESFAYLIYMAFMLLLFATPFLARDIKGSMSWIKIGSFSIQPAEFAKFAVSLCLAKYISRYGFSMQKWTDFIMCGFLVLLPMVLIVMQKETGSALVYSALFLALYREGMPGSILFAGVSAVIYFVVGVRFAEEPLFGLPVVSMGKFLVLACIYFFSAGMMWNYTEKMLPVFKVVGLGLLTTVVSVLFSRYVIPFDVCWVQLALCVGMIAYLFYLAFSERLVRYASIALFAIGSLAFYFSANYVLNNVMEPHQQTRIRVLLGMEDDPRGAGYNVIQAKIAIGSGGLKGKGFLNGTQTKLKYVPEQDTDFIFCTVGEEEGFVGCATVLLLFLTLILRLIHLAERQPTTFGRVYGYCVLSIFLFHLFINVGMVLGLTPVIGIPLPFFSYGGSSLWGFTMLLFIFLRIDASRYRLQR